MKLEEEVAASDIWDNPEEAQKLMQRLTKLKDSVQSYERLQSKLEDVEVLLELAEEDSELASEFRETLQNLKKDVENLELETLLSGEYDRNNAILSLHPGAGGTESQDWAEMLYRMYTRWAEEHGFRVKLLDMLPGEEAGLKSATILIEGENAFGFLKSEKAFTG